MISLTMHTKTCMTELLLRDTFDSFSFIEGEITTCCKFKIDGYLCKDFFEEEPQREYAMWRELRKYCLSVIRGKRTPLEFKLIFSLSQDGILSFIREQNLDFQPDTIQGLYLNFRYDGSSLTCTTGTSLKIFIIDKSLEQAWDKWAQKFLSGLEDTKEQ